MIDKNVKISLIISTYNWVEALNLCLKSVLNQSILPNEIIIADDGSKLETKLLIDEYKKKSPIPIIHVWQEDEGFRLAKIRNKSIIASKFEYIVQIDGDIILHKDFIKNQKTYAKKGVFITGSRVLLLQKTSLKAIETGSINFNFFTNNIKNRFHTLYIPFINYLIRPKSNPIDKLIFKVRGCHMSFWRKDLIEVNGYDENFKNWGREDSELAFRLIIKGLKLKKLKNAAIQYHLYHRENDKSKIEINNLILEKNKKNKKFYCLNGLCDLSTKNDKIII